MQYGYKENVFLPVPAQQVGETLETIRRQSGGNLTPELVLEKASDPSCLLHPCFEWDDTKAAHEHRLNQARYLLRAVVVLRGPKEELRPVRAFVTVKACGENVYKEVHEALAHPDHREQVLARARRELEAWAKRYEALEELAETIAAIKSSQGAMLVKL